MLQIAAFLFVALFSFTTSPVAVASAQSAEHLISRSYEFHDESRNRLLPVEIYVNPAVQRQATLSHHRLPVVIINHGYSVKNTEYSFLAKTLAAQGYYVVSIQHDLETDPPLATTGDIITRRKPLWIRGVQNILFVMQELQRTNTDLDLDKVILIGHSNGGDIAMLFASEHPQLVKKIISLDSLRMPFPRNGEVPILSLRANDTQADEGVLPSKEEAQHLGISLIKLEHARHIDLCDRGNNPVRQQVNELTLKFLS